MTDKPDGIYFQALLEEYKMLHNDNQQRIQFRVQIFGLLLIAMGVLFPLGLQGETPSPMPLLIYPVIATFLALSWTHQGVIMIKLARFILNSEAFEHLVLQGEKDLDGKRFPFFDVVGWIYTKTAEGKTDKFFLDEYLINPDEFRGWMVISYKDAKWFYGTMFVVSFVVSIVLGAIHLFVL
ncbi:hypothetical protein L0337_38425 [candidate division KSB1 bacterium]|nr:hypothetical protein [candidate division KSB1 bacterium]